MVKRFICCLDPGFGIRPGYYRLRKISQKPRIRRHPIGMIHRYVNEAESSDFGVSVVSSAV